MLLNDIQKRLDERSISQISEFEKAIDSVIQRQHENPSAANELMLESLRYRKQKVQREATATGVISRG